MNVPSVAPRRSGALPKPNIAGRFRATTNAAVHQPDGLLKLVGAVLMTAVWRFQDAAPGFGGLKLPLLISIVTVGFFLLDGSPDRKLKSLKSAITFLLLAFCVQLVIASSESINVARSQSFLIHDMFWTIVAFILIACTVRTVRDLRWIFAVNVFGAATYSFFVLLRFRALDGLGRLCCTPYYDANDVSLVLVSTIPYLFFFLRDAESTKVRSFTLGALIVILPVFQLAGSRGGFIGLMIVVLLAMFFFKGIKRSKRVWSVLGTAAALFILGGPAYREKVLSIFKPEEDYNMTDEEGRIAMWKAGMALAKQRPSVGYGPRSFGEAYGTFSERALIRGGIPWRAAHDAYVELSAEDGFPASAIFIAMLFTAIAVSWRVRNRARDPRFGSDGQMLAMLAQSNAIGIVGYLVSSIFLSSEYLTIIYGMLAMTVVLGKLMANLESKATGPKPPRRMPAARPGTGPSMRPPAHRGPAWPARA
jgi:O-antigen ligase